MLTALRTSAAFIAAFLISACAIPPSQPGLPIVAGVVKVKTTPRGTATIKFDRYFRLGEIRVFMRFPIDRSLIDPRQGSETQVLQVFGNGGVVFLDSYASRHAGLNRCQAGRESWVRVFATRSGRQTFARHVESCHRNLDLAEQLFAWRADGTGFTLNAANASGEIVKTDYVIGNDASVVAR